jgi:hypothetical protein
VPVKTYVNREALAGDPDILKALVAELLSPIDVQGDRRFVYSYRRADGTDEAREFLERLRREEPGRYTKYMTGFRFFGMGRARGDVWHMLDADTKPKGVNGDISGIGEFKNIGHKSRILHCNEEALCILLTKFEGKNEDELPAEAINPALAARDDYMLRREQIIARFRRSRK